MINSYPTLPPLFIPVGARPIIIRSRSHQGCTTSRLTTFPTSPSRLPSTTSRTVSPPTDGSSAPEPRRQKPRTHRPDLHPVVAQDPRPLPHQHVQPRLGRPVPRHRHGPGPRRPLGPPGQRARVQALPHGRVEDLRLGQGRGARRHEQQPRT